jgi:hypothetical protein
MGFDLSRLQNVRNETKEELLDWQAQFKPGSPEHIAATVELGRRSDQMNWVKLWGFVVAVLSLLLGAIALIRHW